MNIQIIIPSLNPDERLIEYVKELKSAGMTDILLVDDGSDEDKKWIFSQLEKSEGCKLITHEVNKGKGRALKNAFACFMDNYGENAGVITVDSDGQHRVADVIKCANALEENPDALVLGVRDFDLPNVPPKSAFGNKTTKKVLKFLYGGSISDTQTGLRAISYKRIPDYINLFGERFEYETGMLIEALHNKTEIVEVPIETVYYEENKETHFRPIVDSVKIYGLIFGIFFKFLFSSLSSTIIDLAAFEIITLLLAGFTLGRKVWIATLCARLISSFYNYTINKKVVFKSNTDTGKSLVRYYFLCAIQTAVSAGLVHLFSSILGINSGVLVFVKMVVDTCLFFISFRIQKAWVFKA